MLAFTDFQKPTPDTLTALKKLWTNYPDIFKQVFQSTKDYGEPISSASFDRRIDSLEPLTKAGLIDNYQHNVTREATCQINVIDRSELDDPLFICTDFPKRDKNRVFPYDDEAKEWLNLYIKSGIISQPSTIVDLGCGAGSIGLWLAKYYPHSQVLGFDNNPKALKYAEYNGRLNQISNFQGYLWDALQNPDDYPGDLTFLWRGLQEKVDLICADPPFAMHPSQIQVYEHSRGGEDGSRVAHKNIETASYLLKPGGVFLMITYALGNKSQPTKLLETIERYFPKEHYEWEIPPKAIPRALVWRVSGEKALKPPMDVQYMIIRYNDLDYKDEFEKWTPQMYQEWIDETLINKGLTHLHYIGFRVRKKLK